MEKQYGNVKLIVDEKKGGEIEVYKCPRLNCPEVFLNYQDLQSHKVLTHGLAPKFFKKEGFLDAQGFSMAKVKRLGIYNTKYVFNTYFTMLKLFVSSRHKEKQKDMKVNKRISIKA